MTRIALPARRPSVTFPFDHGGIRYYVTFSDTLRDIRGLLPGGALDAYPASVLEIFLQGGKSGTDLEALARDTACAVSIALQHGADLETLRHAMTRLDDGSAAGPMGKALDMIASRQ